jgi:hypothetical protein
MNIEQYDLVSASIPLPWVFLEPRFRGASELTIRELFGQQRRVCRYESRKHGLLLACP